MRGRSREASKRAELDKVEAALQGERERLAETEAALEHAIEQRDVIEDRRAFDENDDRIAELRKDVAWSPPCRCPLQGRGCRSDAEPRPCPVRGHPPHA